MGVLTERVPDSPPAARCRIDPEDGRITLAGSWTTVGLDHVSCVPPEGLAGTDLIIDASGIDGFDTGGAWVLLDWRRELEGRGHRVAIDGLGPQRTTLLNLVTERRDRPVAPARAPRLGWLGRLGQGTWGHIEQGRDLLGFVGETTLALLRLVRRPQRFRGRALVVALASAGVDAVPIVALLSFLIGVVIAYQGGMELKLYGANIYVVELVTITMLRELAPMMTAIIVAGRTGSAYTAEIGTMAVTEEIDALRTLGISPMDILVLPKLLGLMLALPLLTVLADAAGVLGGAVMSALTLEVGLKEFMERIPAEVPVEHLLLGVGKAPVFAAIVAMVGCYQGFRVSGGPESVGRRTTQSVVQAIFLVIVADAAFSVLFSWLGI
jgi:phospholipid/cholesterol/gamma-HCH transport system permease protein